MHYGFEQKVASRVQIAMYGGRGTIEGTDRNDWVLNVEEKCEKMKE